MEKRKQMGCTKAMVFLAGDTAEEEQKQRREGQIPRLGGSRSGKHTVLINEDRHRPVQWPSASFFRVEFRTVVLNLGCTSQLLGEFLKIPHPILIPIHLNLILGVLVCSLWSTEMTLAATVDHHWFQSSLLFGA